MAPQSPQPVPSASEDAPKRGFLGGRLKLRNWRVRTRLFALIAVPTIVAALLAGYRVQVSMDDADAFSQTGDMATLGKDLTALTQQVENERDAMARLASGGVRAIDEDQLKAIQQAVNAAARKVRETADGLDVASPATEQAIDNVLDRADDLAALRSVSTRLASGVIITKYGEFIDDFSNYHLLVAQEAPTPGLAQTALALADLAKAKNAASRERALIAAALYEGGFSPFGRAAVDDARTGLSRSIDTFRGLATPAQLRIFEDTVAGPELDRAEISRLRTLAVADASPSLRVRLGRNFAQDWANDSNVRVTKLHEVERNVAAELADTANEAKSDAQTDAIRDGALLFLVLAIVLATVILVARSLVRPLLRLQSGALEVAGTRLPGLVDRLRDPEAAAGGIEVEPIEIDSTDEIGQVARAFDEVHREAVRLAADEAVLRGNINAMFVNLSRRSQSLIERQLRLIEELEQSERDEEQLGNLFRLDHLATRMRRNCENLLVLGGQEQVRRWNQAVPLIDVVRASLSEVEQYERVALRVQGDMTVAGPVVNDLVHLLAELIENATVFSSEHTKVTVSGQMLSGGGSMLQITDNGVGMSAEELEQANWRLANPPVIDFSAARRMGLFVVGRLAVRHGIRVELRAAQGGGLTAFVVLPDAVITPGESNGVGARGFGGRETEGQQLAALTATAEPPAIGSGGAFRQDDYGPAGQPAGAPMGGGTGSHSMIGGSGTGPLRPLRGGTGPQPAMNETGPIPAAGTGAHAAFPGTGPQQALPHGEQGPPGARRPPADDPYQPGDGQPPRRPGELPIRRPGAQLPGRPADDGMSNGLFQPRSERQQDGGAAGNGAYHPPGGPQSVVPEAQPVVPEPGTGRQIPWGTGPLEQVSGNSGQPSHDPYGDASATGAHPRPGRAQWETGEIPAQEPARPGAMSAPHAPEEVANPVPEPSMRAPQAPPAQAPPEQKAPPRVPERSPIFDAMQSEWFMRRSGDGSGEDPVRGWESPADAGFRAAEAAREPVATSRTNVGLPKRVPGKNRVPGAVGRAATPAGGAQAAGPAQGQAAPQGQAQPAPGGHGPGQHTDGQQGFGQTADVVRNRFASLQRGVHRGRHEARGAGTSGEAPSQGDGETGGTR
ncbi:nitrate- and nitrite sensing domain-containing protein [Actinomadura sp. 7K507]|uniref:sensor histidine kinase n=1 Tax=Actinomadura sp. 7K507 TaxID=2530365 RepID=UPI00104B195C|nr:nitrate- and nitrite sensing domain-containing protein [Actinomadura sp. 7K507]TDC91003.1 HAMP domain-containing protein [Actinomadura sp. 7K507]